MPKIPGHMSVALLIGPSRMVVRRMTVPASGEGLLLRVLSCGICGSDRRQFQGANNGEAKIAGHEIVGEVVEASPAHDAWLNKIVGVAPRIGCGECGPCTRGFPNLCSNSRVFGYQIPGGFAQFTAIPREAVEAGNLVEVPDPLSADVATLAEPLSCVINGLDVSRPKSGTTVAVIGAGPMGQLFVMASRDIADEVCVAEPNQARRDFALRHGADQAFPSAEGLPEADLIVVACSDPGAYRLAIERAPPGSTINLFGGLGDGIGIDSNRIHYRQLTVHGTSGSTPEQYARAIRMLDQEPDYAEILTDIISLRRLPLFLRGRTEVKRLSLKAIANPSL